MIFNPQAKIKPVRSRAYLAFIREHPCGHFACFDKAEPHHIRRHEWGAGTGIKPHDYVAVPRCRKHHNEIFEVEVEKEIISLLKEWVEKDNVDPDRLIIDLLIGYIGRG